MGKKTIPTAATIAEYRALQEEIRRMEAIQAKWCPPRPKVNASFQPPTPTPDCSAGFQGQRDRVYYIFRAKIWGEWWRIDGYGKGRAARLRQAQAEVDEHYAAPPH